MNLLVDIKRIREDQEGTTMEIFIPNRALYEYVYSHCIKKGELIISDGRQITPMQRRKAYAMEGDIAEYCGYLSRGERHFIHEELKIECQKQYGIPAFSLSTCSVDMARAYINFLIEYALENGVVLSDYILNRSDDIDSTLIACIRAKRCCLCGRPGEIHHIDTIGMGNDRKTYDDSYNRIICLCRAHHTEAHAKGVQEFCRLHKVYGIEKYRTERGNR